MRGDALSYRGSGTGSGAEPRGCRRSPSPAVVSLAALQAEARVFFTGFELSRCFTSRSWRRERSKRRPGRRAVLLGPPPRYPHSTEVAGFEPKFRADDRHGSLRGLVQSPARADRNKHLAVGGFRPPQVTHRLHKFLGAPVYRLYRFQVRFSIHLVHLKGLCTLTTAS